MSFLSSFFNRNPAPAPQQGPWKQPLRARSIAFMVNKTDTSALQAADKIILPTMALQELGNMQVSFPMTFELINPQTQRSTVVGVQEFDAETGIVYVPQWVLNNLGAEHDDLLMVKNVKLPKGTYVKFQPHQYAFTQLSNPRVVLEHTLRSFTCLHLNDTLVINHSMFHHLHQLLCPTASLCRQATIPFECHGAEAR